MSQLNSILATNVTVSENDLPAHVEGCSMDSALGVGKDDKVGRVLSPLPKKCRRTQILPRQQRCSNCSPGRGAVRKSPETDNILTPTRLRHIQAASTSKPPLRKGVKRLLEIRPLPYVRLNLDLTVIICNSYFMLAGFDLP